MSTLQILGINAVAIFLYMTGLWIASLVRKNVNLADSFLGLGFVISTVVYFIFSDGILARKLLVLVLVAIWGLLHSFRAFLRNVGKPEHSRYRALRDRQGSAFIWLSYFQVFLARGVVIWIASVCLLAAQHGVARAGLGAWDIAGVLVWMVGFLFESVGNWQLARFTRRPDVRGRVMDQGLWRYTRHPHYFGEAVMWWAYYLFAVAAGGWWSFFSPLLMTLLLWVLSLAGPEKQRLQAKPGYAEYVARTSAFIVWLPRRRSQAVSEREEGTK